MEENLYSKEQIIQKFSNNNCFVDSETLNKLLKKRNIEAIFENDKGIEFFEKATVEKLVAEYISKNNKNGVSMKNTENAKEVILGQEDVILSEDSDTNKLLNNIKLDDGESLLSKVKDTSVEDIIQPDEHSKKATPIEERKRASVGILEGALSGINKESKVETSQIDNQDRKDDVLEINEVPNLNIEKNDTENIQIEETNIPVIDITDTKNNKPLDETVEVVESEVPVVDVIEKPDTVELIDAPKIDLKEDKVQNTDELYNETSADVDDMSLLSDSFKAREKFREYVASNMPNQQINPMGEFNTVASERTINIIAKTMAKKIAKYVGQICLQDAKTATKGNELEEQNKILINKIKGLEEQNKKLRLLLTETTRNLDSYKPLFFDLYIKTKPKNQ